MNAQNTEQVVVQIISKYAPGVGVALDTKLQDVGIDSLTLSEVIFDIEEALDVDLPNDAEILKRFGTFQAVGDIVASLDSVLTEKRSTLAAED
jgi:acyl carrier protein